MGDLSDFGRGDAGEAEQDVIVIGLFGTCGGSRWRDVFMAEYDRLGIVYFNPQVPDWKPECATIEARHLAEDQIVLFPVTAETYGTGSLAEVGFSILNAIKLDDRRDFVVMIEYKPADALKENAALYKESCRARALVLQHLMKLRLSNVYLVRNLEEMLKVSIELHRAATLRLPLAKYSLKGG